MCNTKKSKFIEEQEIPILGAKISILGDIPLVITLF